MKYKIRFDIDLANKLLEPYDRSRAYAMRNLLPESRKWLSKNVVNKYDFYTKDLPTGRYYEDEYQSWDGRWRKYKKCVRRRTYFLAFSHQRDFALFKLTWL